MTPDGKAFSGATATQGPFELNGGRVRASAVSANWNSGTLALERLGPDGSTYLPVKDDAGNAVSFTANGMSAAISLPGGLYEFVLTGTVTFSAEIAPIPN